MLRQLTSESSLVCFPGFCAHNITLRERLVHRTQLRSDEKSADHSVNAQKSLDPFPVSEIAGQCDWNHELFVCSSVCASRDFLQ
jgi:hypothetical protein